MAHTMVEEKGKKERKGKRELWPRLALVISDLVHLISSLI